MRPGQHLPGFGQPGALHLIHQMVHRGPEKIQQGLGIDADPEKYPVELLYRWKRQTEAEARASIGRRSGMSSDELFLLSEAETLCGDAIEYLRYIVEKDCTHLMRISPK